MLFLGESRFLLSSDVTVVVVHPVDGPLVLLVKEETFEFERGAKLATLDAQVPRWKKRRKVVLWHHFANNALVTTLEGWSTSGLLQV